MEAKTHLQMNSKPTFTEAHTVKCQLLKCRTSSEIYNTVQNVIRFDMSEWGLNSVFSDVRMSQSALH